MSEMFVDLKEALFDAGLSQEDYNDAMDFLNDIEVED